MLISENKEGTVIPGRAKNIHSYNCTCIPSTSIADSLCVDALFFLFAASFTAKRDLSNYINNLIYAMKLT